MISVLHTILTIFATAAFVVGSFVNVFITLVNCRNWMKRQSISSVERILTALAVSRIGLLLILFKSWFSTLVNTSVHSGLISLILWIITNDFSTWISTSLSIFYLLKITNFSNYLFFHLKKRVHSVIVLTLWSGLLLLLSRLVILSVHHAMELEKYEGNVTWRTELGKVIMIVFTVGYFIPIIISIICFLLLIYSLHKHLRQMRQYSNGSQDPSTKVQVKALKSMVSFLLLIAMYSLSEIMSNWTFKVSPHESVFSLSQTLGILYPSIHSCVLIWGNRKLKQAFVLHVWQARCCCRKRNLQDIFKNSDAV
ncbi:taste receptor type 2 member 20-like [Octodon degus]|uniref:Taste receptor type 2 n=1 Tax=Octodon degus TaxID=10160 RepID=A0A6P6DYX4_OCTDE|nr:taste receptor type 2 member 20-like [Octodon degus]